MVAPQRVTVCGSINVDSVWVLPEIPQPHTKIRALDHFAAIGGSATHTAAMIARYGHHVTLLGDLPNDIKGQWCVEQIQQLGVDVAGIEMGSVSTVGEAAVMLCGTDKRIITSPKNVVNSPKLTQCQTEVLDSAAWVHLATSDIQRAREITTIVLQRRERGQTVFLSVETKGRIYPEVLEHTDFAFINSQEFRHLFGFPVEEASQHGPLDLIRNKCTLIVTNEGRPIFALQNCSEARCISTSYPVENIGRHIINRNGAGDSFNGGFICSYLETQNLQESIYQGQEAAVQKLTHA